MVQFSNLDRVMEDRDHLKNRTSSKSLMSRGNLLRNKVVRVSILLAIAMTTFALTSFVFACSRASGNKSGTSNLTEITSLNLEIKIKELLPEGKIVFEVLDSLEITVRQTELTYKFAEAYRENIEGFNAYIEKTRNNQKAKYPENEILSESEYSELMEFYNSGYAPKLLSTQTEIVEIIYTDDNRILFKANGKFAEIFNLITYHTETNTFYFANPFNLVNRYSLKFVDTLHVETNTNAFRETWKGYQWEFAEPKDMEMPTTESISRMSMKQFKIRLGKLLSSGKTFMIIELKDLREGNWAVNVEITIRMK